ncbi:MAG: hypothetical protein ACK4SF_13865 [Algoriphagus aquaeductus]|jgi:hypothetical protein|uniref:Uncharacterized protein n=1 Tax=Algoriphagus aquaeductus TaxID=475299 RepID=A0A326RT90_9BACT|nr:MULTISPECIES: hypothetical protein [Algoriphagus]PZV83884.1 hypothetical protein CLV31_105109 [Algoriphagus aquaeductus]
MSVAVQINSSENSTTSWTVSTSPESVNFHFGQQDILKISSQPIANKMQGMCRFENGFEKLLPLFRGLILLGKPSSLSLIYDFTRAQVFFTYAHTEAQEVDKFFGKVIDMLKNEVRFKQILEKVIQNNRKYQAEQALLQTALHRVNWD